MTKAIVALLCQLPWLDRLITRSVATNDMSKAASGQIRLTWNLLIPFIYRQQARIRTYSLLPHPDGWHVFVVQVGARGLEDHSHKDLGSYPLLPEAIAAAERHSADEWQEPRCECGEIIVPEATDE